MVVVNSFRVLLLFFLLANRGVLSYLCAERGSKKWQRAKSRVEKRLEKK